MSSPMKVTPTEEQSNNEGTNNTTTNPTTANQSTTTNISDQIATTNQQMKKTQEMSETPLR
jgi:hypothetical protein